MESEPEYFTKWDGKGFTREEALKKATLVDEAHGVPLSRWNRAYLVPDPVNSGKFMVAHTYNK